MPRRERNNLNGFWDYLKHKELNFFPNGKLQWWLIAIITIAWATEQFERTRLSPVLVYFLEDFNISLKEYGLLHLAAVLASGVGAYILGNIADKYGRRPAIIWPMIIYLVLLAGLASAPNIWIYSIFFTLGAFLIMGMSAAVSAAIRDIVPRKGRAVGYAFISLAWATGAFMTFGVAAATLPFWPGWRPQHWIGLIIGGIITVFVTICYRDLSPRMRSQIVADKMEASEASAKSLGVTDIEYLKNTGNMIYQKPHIWMLCSVLFWFGVTYGFYAAYLPTYMTQWHNIPPSKAAQISTIVFLVGGLTGFISGYIADKTGLRKLIVTISVSITGINTIIFGFLPRDTPYQVLFLYYFINALFVGCIYPNWCALLAENAEDINPFSVGRAFGLAGVMTMGSGFILALVLPQVVERLGWNIWSMIAGAFCLMNIIWISFAKGPWLKKSEKVWRSSP